MSKAADSFFISQPALSKHIRNLEQELGVVLFRRSSGGVVLTEAGRLVYGYFTAAGQGFKSMLDEALRVSGGAVTTLRLGVPEDWDVSRFTLTVKPRFLACHPNVVINTSCQSELTTMIRRLRENCFDALFLPFIPSSYMEGITAVRLTSVPMALLVSRKNPLCSREALRPADFKNELFLVTGHDGFDIAKRAMYRYLEPYGFAPRVETRDNMNSVILGVLNNEGVTLRDVWSLSINHPELRYLELDAAQDVYLAYRTDDDSRPLRDFIAMVLAHLSGEP